MSEDTVVDVGWDSAYLEERRGRWSSALSDEERGLLWADTAARRWGPGDGVRARVRASVLDALRAVGFAHVRNLMDTTAPEDEVAANLSFLLREFGGVVPQNAAGDLTQVLRDRDGDGATELGFHCDTCDLLVLLCLRPSADGGGQTRLASARRVHDIIGRERPDALAELRREWRFDRTGRAGPQLVVSPILFTQDDGTVGCYYQTRTVRASAEAPGGRPLTPAQWDALAVLDEVLYRPEIAFGLRLEAGELLVIRNSRVLHGRSPYTDAPGDRSRRMLRLWMSSEAV
ncbi:TauD/TfdA family dioxygenase [Nocardiopsis trehalosi]|uniref:TauD/TfdA family dioxygenase n=1 Tax=Nocardiopsis trehalosi TaxID=109329 RepID=UPI00082E603F|nr:TauD/TfdA family dioxygenase [Nocardiopsis trehalosi]